MNINLLIKSVDIFDHNYEKSFISDEKNKLFQAVINDILK